MNKIISFVKGSFEEIRTNVSWPQYSELQNSSLLVLFASLIFALFIGFIDYLFENGMSSIYQSF